jgi:hypothetical protein
MREHRPAKFEKQSQRGVTGCVTSEEYFDTLTEVKTDREHKTFRNREMEYFDIGEIPYYVVTTFADSIYIIEKPVGEFWQVR